MVQDMHHQPVPEELYNLTQLADVTLAAGKLSTTNLDKIKDYIRSEANICNSHETETILSNELHFIHSDNQIAEFNNRGSSTIKSRSEMYKGIQTENNKNYFKSFTFKDNKLESKIHSVITSQISEKSIRDGPSLLFDRPSNKRATALTMIGEKQNMSLLSLSSSEEDNTTFNYSHKIFDKRKSRKLSYHSDDSDTGICQLKKQSNEHPSYLTGNFERRDYDDSQMSSETDSNDYGEITKSDGGIGDDIHVCPECGKKYSTSSNLARHRQTHRSLMDKKARRCPHCDKVYVSMPAFSMHVRTHNQGCECPHCGKRFSRPWLLQGHIRTHTGEKPFQCSICAKAFADKSNLRAHVQTHSNTKPHTCARCGKAFALKSYLYKHEESSCMRNHLKTPDRVERSETEKSSSSIVAKILKKGRSNSDSTTRKIKDKFVNHINSAASSKNEQESIVMDYGSQKSYIDLTNPISKHDLENFSRISVIRTALSNSNQSTNTYDSIQFGFYQEKPMDFSPKNKFQNNGNGNFEITRNYAIVA